MLKKLRSPLYLALLIPALLALTDFVAPLDHVYRNIHAKLGGKSSTDSIVVITFSNAFEAADDRGKSTTVGSHDLALVLEKLALQMPQRVVVDSPVAFGVDEEGDRALTSAFLKLHPDAIFVARSKENNTLALESKDSDFLIPPGNRIPGAKVALSAWGTNFIDYGIASRYSIEVGGRQYPTLSAELAGVKTGAQDRFQADYLFDIDSIPHLSAGKFIKGDYPPGLLTGRTVIVNSTGVATPLGLFGRGRVHPLALDLAGYQSLRKPFALDLGHHLLLGIVWLLANIASRREQRRRKFLCYGMAVGTAVFLPAVLFGIGFNVEPSAAMLCLMIYGAARLWQLRMRKIKHTSEAGLPNLLALSAQPVEVGHDVIVAVIARYEEILATLPKDLHGECARQIARRLSVGSGIETIYKGEGGHFAWTEEARPLEMQLNHLEGLRALFAAPLQIGSHTFDTNIHFGLDRNEGIDAPTRVNSALASANDALASGRAIELFEAERLAEAPWELSLHARIDEGLRNGEIWLAYQAQWDMKRAVPCGAEALIRWNHPTRGPIAPDAFILQAERAGRIDALTYWVLEEAITATLALNASVPPFHMSVNLSAQMVDKPSLVSNFVEIVRRRGIDPRLLTIEVTETSSVRNRPAAVQNLSQLRAMGFRLSIDDFGTGEASLAYLADLPSDELKLDRRFVSRILTHDREAKIVQSTIHLAHVLGQTVVAEGIEDQATYQALMRLGCDVGQGYFLGRPQPFDEFQRFLLKTGHRRFGSV
ncbi:MAG: EAL domain-containing protein [Novosphingobium sp.]